MNLSDHGYCNINALSIKDYELLESTEKKIVKQQRVKLRWTKWKVNHVKSLTPAGQPYYHVITSTLFLDKYS